MSHFVLCESIIKHLIKKNELSDLLCLFEEWIKYDNKRFETGINYIFENSDGLTDEFFDRFIVILDKYGKTEFALKCVRKLIETHKKERFEL